MPKAFHFISANNKHHLQKIKNIEADTIIIDLEDAVPEKSKSEARENVSSLNLNELKNEVYVRINNLSSNQLNDDLYLMKTLPENVGLVVPKLNNIDEINFLISNIGNKIKIIPLVEDFSALNNYDEVLNHDNVIAVGLGMEDMLLNIPYSNESLNLLIDNVRLELFRKALGFNILPIDIISSNVNDIKVFEDDCIKARRMGYTAKFSIHPSQIGIINNIFSANKAEVEWANTILKHDTVEESGYIMHPDGVLTSPPKIKKAKSIKNYEKSC